MWGKGALSVAAVVLCIALMTVVTAQACAGEIHDAAAESDLEAVRRLVEGDPSLVRATDQNERTALHWACCVPHPELVQYLIESGADVNALDINHIVPLHSAATRGYYETAKLLVKHGAILDSPDYEKHTALHYAALRGHANVAELLVGAGADVEARNGYGRTPLLLAARESGSADVARVLVAGGADINAKDRAGWSSLELAAWRGFGELIDVLMDEGVEIAVEGIEATRLLQYSTRRGLERLFRHMVKNGADLSVTSEQGGSLLHSAAQSPSREIVNLLLEDGMNQDEPDTYGWSPLHHAAEMGRVVIIKLLVEKGAAINSRTISGKTPLNIAQELGCEEAAETLIAMGADQTTPHFPVLEGPYMGQEPPGAEPEVFALGIVSGKHRSHSSLIFSPDGNEAYWTPTFTRPEAGYGRSTVYRSVIRDGRWTLPVIAPFSQEYRADVPFFSSDGSRLYFMSMRPVEGSGPGTRRIWYIDRQGGGWSEPMLLDTPANNMDIHWQFSLDREGNLYFGGSSGRDIGGGDIYVSRYVDGEYLEPVNLGEKVNTEGFDCSPYIAPDGSYLLFTRILDSGQSGLFISFKKDEVWTEAREIWPGAGGDRMCSVVSPDCKYIFYLGGAGGVEGICWVDAGVIETIREEVLGN